MKDVELYGALLGLGENWRVGEVKLDMVKQQVDIKVVAIDGIKHACPVCGTLSPVYDHTNEQTWRHLDTCQCKTYVHCQLPRIGCPVHNVKQITAPWAGPRSGFTLLMESKISDTLKECDVTGVTRLTNISWDIAWRVMERAVERGKQRKEKRIPEYIGIDEKSFARRHNYETLVCDIKKGTIEYVTDDRGQESLEQYYKQFTKAELAGVKAVAMDIWDPYIAATKAYVPFAADKIVFDRFHVVRLVNEAVDKVRRQEHKSLTSKGDNQLARTKHLWLANEDNIPEFRREEFNAIQKENLRTGKAWAIKEALREFWRYTYTKCAERFFDRWYFWATHSRLTPMINAAKTIKRRLANVLTYFRNKITNATSEGINSKIQMVKEMSCGFRNREHYKTAIYFHCGGLDLYPRMMS